MMTRRALLVEKVSGESPEIDEMDCAIKRSAAGERRVGEDVEDCTTTAGQSEGEAGRRWPTSAWRATFGR